MRFTVCLWLAAAVAAQAPGPAGVVRGDLLEWEAARGSGGLSIRTATHQVYQFTFDSKTYFERENQRSVVEKLQKGDLLEIVSDSSGLPGLAYARTVHVLERGRRRPAPLPGLYRGYRAPERPLPPGNATVAGMVARLQDGRLVLRTRRDGEKTVLLREDTRFLAGGLQVPSEALEPGTLVFVRGARNFEDELEAQQVVWGEILRSGP